MLICQKPVTRLASVRLVKEKTKIHARFAIAPQTAKVTATV